MCFMHFMRDNDKETQAHRISNVALHKKAKYIFTRHGLLCFLYHTCVCDFKTNIYRSTINYDPTNNILRLDVRGICIY